MIKKCDAHSVVFENFKSIIHGEDLPVSIIAEETHTDYNGDKQVSFGFEFAPSYENQINEALNKAVRIAIDIIGEG